MAVSIMSACCRASVLSLSFLACFLQVLLIQGQVFRAPRTHDVFLRSKRANMFLVEEILQGNLERECYEELCSYEEAREYFEDTDKTIAFWTVYFDGDQCQPNPCLHGGICTDRVGGFHCSCTAPHHGPACELGALGLGGAGGAAAGEPPSAAQTTRPEISECPTEGPTACHQLCTASYHSFSCSCMPGFKLQSDRRSCRPAVEFPCGRLPDQFNSTASVCRHGNCPWQVSLMNSRGVELCAGAVLGRRSVLTAARCLFLDSESSPRPSNFFVVTGDQKTSVSVRALYVHSRFHPDHHDSDLALLELAGLLPFSPALIHLCLPPKEFSENILMHSGRTGVSRTQKLVYMTLDECRSQLNVSHPLSNKMFCMRRQNGAAGRQNGPGGNRKRVQRSINGASEYQNGAHGMLNGPLGNQSGAQGRAYGPLGKQNEAQRSQNGPLGKQNEAQRSQNGPLGKQNEAHERLTGHSVNQNQTQNGAHGIPNGAENRNSGSSKIQNPEPSDADGSPRSKVSGRLCGGLLPGSPVVSVQQGTTFLTGLLMSAPPPSAGCDGGGLVFTKLSRYLGWIRPRLEAAEDHMTPQVSQYPENR